MWSIFVKGINVFLLRTAINESNNIYSVYATQSAGNKKKKRQSNISRRICNILG